MRKWLLLFVVMWWFGCSLHLMPVGLYAQTVVRATSRTLPATIDSKTGDTIAVIALRPVYCFNKKRFRTTRQEKSYWRMVNDVKKTLPIAKQARRILAQSYDTIQHITGGEKEQRAYFKGLEKELWAEYKPKLKRLNYRQGKLLVRLIDRECQSPSYQLIREFMGKRKAFFWQSFGRLFGVNLKSEWDPDGKDKDLEDICLQVEQGLL